MQNTKRFVPRPATRPAPRPIAAALAVTALSLTLAACGQVPHQIAAIEPPPAPPPPPPVAAYGQKLRGDPLMGAYSFTDVVSLAGRQDDFWRQEFVKLATIAGGLD
jgi:hypothetical protein